MSRPPLILVMARLPQPGQAKTRLAAVLGSDAAFRLYSAMVEDTLDLARSMSAGTRGVAVYWASGGDGACGVPSAGAAPGGSTPVRHELQAGATFAARLGSSIRRELSGGPVICIGTDSPTLPPEYLSSAMERLVDARPTVVLGPAADGGYYLIGMNLWIPEMFDGVDWGTSKVLAQSIQRAQTAGVEPLLLPEWYDIDRPEDLARLLKERAGAPRTAAVADGL